MGDFCSMCMKPSTYSGFIISRGKQMEHIFDGAYCNEHMIEKLRQTIAFLEERHKVWKEE